MSLNVYIDGAGRSGRRPGPLAVSLLLHGSAFFVLMNAPEIKLPERSKSAYQQAVLVTKDLGEARRMVAKITTK